MRISIEIQKDADVLARVAKIEIDEDILGKDPVAFVQRAIAASVFELLAMEEPQ